MKKVKTLVYEFIAFLNVRFQLFGAPKMDNTVPEQKVISPAYPFEGSAPLTIDDKLHWKFRAVQKIFYPETFVSILDNGSVWGDAGVVITKDNKLYSAVSRFYYKTGKELLIYKNWRKLKPVFIDASVAVISTAGSEVYYHWMLDITPRLEILQKSGFLEKAQYFIVDYEALSFQKEMLIKLGIDESRIIASTNAYKFHVQAKELIVPSLVSPNDAPSREACLFIRNLFAPDRSTKPPFRRLYIQRKKNRKIINEHPLMDVLTKEGFEIVQAEQLSLAQQAHLFSEAAFIVAPHGAGLTNLVFCEPGAKVIDIFSPEWVNPCYWILSSHLGLDYAYLIGEGRKVADGYDPVGLGTDITVDIARFMQLFNLLSTPKNN